MEQLTSSDRCDRCGVQAYVRVSRGTMILDFCGHDFNKLGESLDTQDWSIVIDTRELLMRRPVGAEVS
jgi:hypothetical protein